MLEKPCQVFSLKTKTVDDYQGFQKIKVKGSINGRTDDTTQVVLDQSDLMNKLVSNTHLSQCKQKSFYK